MRKGIAAVSVCVLWLTLATTGLCASTPPPDVVTVFFFWGDGCPHCAQEHLFLQGLSEKHGSALQVVDREVWYDQEGKALLLEMANERGVGADAVPITFVGERSWIGFNETIAKEIAEAVEAAISGAAGTTAAPLVRLRVPFVGEIDLQSRSLVWATLLIGLVDGMNPCSLWVLSLLLAMVLRSGSRERVLLVGSTFLIVTSALYGLFVAGVFGVFAYIGYLRWIQVLVAVIAFMVGMVNVKEYFAFGQGPSLTISAADKPRIYQGIRHVMAQQNPMMAVVTTVALAAGVCLMELPCTAGFPIVWSNLLTNQGVGRVEFVALLLLYMLLYLFDELMVFFTAVITLRASRLQERHGRLLKLGGGSLMLAFAGTLLIKPELMNELSGTLLVCLAALIVTLAVTLVHGGIERRRRLTS